jgi:hypothetical protein
MSMNYTSYTLRLASFITTNPDNVDYTVLIPSTIDYAEQRVYRELDLLSTVVTNDTASTTAGNRNFTLPTGLGKFVTVQTINIITPASTAPNSGTRRQLTPVDRRYLDAVWNSSTGATVPKHFAMNDQDTIIFGPWPDATYRVEVVGTIRPTPLSYSNPTTFLTNYLPDLFLSASMAFFAKNLQDKGVGTANNAEFWDNNYKELYASANAEELRKKFAGPSWTSMSSVKPPER